MSSICFDDELWAALSLCMERLKPGARVISLKMPASDKFEVSPSVCDARVCCLSLSLFCAYVALLCIPLRPPPTLVVLRFVLTPWCWLFGCFFLQRMESVFCKMTWGRCSVYVVRRK